MALAPPAAAQSTTGSLQGIVRDGQEGALPGVSVTVRNIGTQLLRTTITDATGSYDVQLLPPGVITTDLTGLGSRSDRRDA